MLKTSGLTYSYPMQDSLSFPDLALERGSSLLVLGKSGSGKTTFLHLLAGLLHASAGEIVINNKRISDFKAAQMDHFRGKEIGIIFQKNYFIRSLSVLENLKLAPFLSGNKSDPEKLNSISERLGIHSLHSKKTFALSEGEQQRVCIARALLNNPGLILADEPTSSLDDENCTRVSELLKEEASQANATLLIVTHDQRLKNSFSDHIEL